MLTLTKKQFDAYCLCRDPLLRTLSKELEWYATDDRTVLAAIIHDFTDDDYGYVILGRDAAKMFRCIDVDCSYPTIEQARKRLFSTLDKYFHDGQTAYPQGDERKTPNEIFIPVVSEEKLNPIFRLLLHEPRFEAAKNLIREIVYSYTDPDGNYIKDFQTTGFNARLWELYLYMYLYTAGFHLVRDCPAPDFHVSHYGTELFIEATTVNPGQDPNRPDALLPDTHEDALMLCEDYMPIKFGSSLFSKLKKRYWDLPHVTGKPLIFAVHDFHAPGSMTWSRTALSNYLYGIKVRLDSDASGTPQPRYDHIVEHVWEDKRIPSGFFQLPDAENISAVLFSNAATLPKFNRMGKLAGLGCEGIKMFRNGFLYDPAPNVFTPVPFFMDVDSPHYEESWSDSIIIYHNPKALIPVDPAIFSDISQFWYDEQQGFTGMLQPFDVLSSVTLTICPLSQTDTYPKQTPPKQATD